MCLWGVCDLCVEMSSIKCSRVFLEILDPMPHIYRTILDAGLVSQPKILETGNCSKAGCHSIASLNFPSLGGCNLYRDIAHNTAQIFYFKYFQGMGRTVANQA
jgi:hypothetical protein